MQGWKHFIPTEKKITYINALLQVGFDTIDFGSFVSHKAIPQMADTADVLAGLDLSNTTSRLLAIVANTRGAQDAVQHDAIRYLGFPFSVSDTFQQRNTGSSMEASLQRVEAIQELCLKHEKELVIYISMGFGNPYGDPWSEELVFTWVNRIRDMGVSIISLADTVGLATANQISDMVRHLRQTLPGIETGVHLHSGPKNREEKLKAALEAGCTRIDGALKGIGGCPMANDELVGNLDSAWIIGQLEAKELLPRLNKEALHESLRIADEIFQ